MHYNERDMRRLNGFSYLAEKDYSKVCKKKLLI